MSLEQILVHMVQTFNRYSGTNGKSGELDHSELKKLVKAEFPALRELAKDDELLTSVMKVMDLDSEKTVTYREYAYFLASLSIELESFVDAEVCCQNPGPNLEQVAVQMVQTFKKYCSADVQCRELDQSELASLVEEEFPALGEEVVSSLMQMMDLDGDKKVSYQEYARFLAFLSMELEECV